MLVSLCLSRTDFVIGGLYHASLRAGKRRLQLIDRVNLDDANSGAVVRAAHYGSVSPGRQGLHDR